MVFELFLVYFFLPLGKSEAIWTRPQNKSAVAVTIANVYEDFPFGVYFLHWSDCIDHTNPHREFPGQVGHIMPLAYPGVSAQVLTPDNFTC